MSRHFRSTVECYDCHRQVQDLREHRASGTCSPKQKFSGKTRAPVLGSGDNSARKKLGRDVFLLMDVSGSMAGSKIEEAKRALLTVHTRELADTDRLAVVTFDTNAYYRLKPRPNGQLLREGDVERLVGRIKTEGGTALYDAIWLTVEDVRDKTRPSTLIVLTDGEDNASAHTLQEVLDAIAQFPALTLDIVHVDGTAPVAAFQQLTAAGRGQYKRVTVKVIVETIVALV